jgi:hypothetical protein
MDLADKTACFSPFVPTPSGCDRAAQLPPISAAARLPTFLSVTSRSRSSSGLSSENTLFICPSSAAL